MSYAAPLIGPIRIALVEDETLVREGVTALMNDSPGLLCVTSAHDHATGVREAEVAQPHVALLDMTLHDPVSRQGLRLWRERLPDVRLLIFDDLVRDSNIQLVLKMQLAGYVTKCDSFAEIVDVIRKAAMGEAAFTSAIQSRLHVTSRGWQLHPTHGTPGLHCLTERETEVLTYVAQGYTGKQCSALLGISPSTVENHKARIMKKLKVRKTLELTRLALREGLVPR